MESINFLRFMRRDAPYGRYEEDSRKLVLNKNENNEEQDDGMVNVDLNEDSNTNNCNVTITMNGRYNTLQNFHYKQLYSHIMSKKTYVIGATITLACIIWILISKSHQTSNVSVVPDLRSNILPDITVNQYNIHITPDIENRYYDGYVEIIFNTTSEIDSLNLLAVADIATVKILRRNQFDFDHRNYTAVTLKNNQTLESLLVTFKHKLIIGEYKLCIKYKGKMVFNLSEPGLYLNGLFKKVFRHYLFTNVDYNKKHYIFPCLNKPQIESAFNLSLTIPSFLEAHGNSRERTVRRTSTNQNVYNFELETMPLASFGFAITSPMLGPQFVKKYWNFYATESLRRSYCVSLIYHISTRILFSLEKYFEPRLALNKLHIIIIPDNQLTHSFRNLILYSENICVNIKDDTDYEYIDELTKILTNSILDQWFGHSFLNEDDTKNEIAFLRGLKLFLLSYIIEEYKHDVRKLNETKYVDIFNSFRTEITRKHLSIEGDDAGYDHVKISIILLMLKHSLSDDHFRNNLLDILIDEKIRVKPIAEKIHYFQTKIDTKYIEREEKLGNWFNLIGFPIISISLDHVYKALKFTSEGITDFYKIDKFNSPERLPSNLLTPITYTTFRERNFELLDTVMYVSSDKPNQVGDTYDISWIIANIQQCGYYRVNYEESLWQKIIAFLTANDQNHKIIHVVNRAKLIDDAAHLADAGYLNYTILFDLMSYLRYESELLPWITTKHAIEYLEHKLLDAEFITHLKFKEMLQELFSQYYRTYVVLTKPEGKNMKEYEFGVEYGCQLQILDCLSAASLIYSDWKVGKEIKRLSGKEMRMHTCNTIRHGRGHEFNFMMEYYYLMLSDDDRKIVMETLGCTQSAENMKRYLELTLNQTTSTNNFLQNAIKKVLSNIKGMDVVLTFVQDEYSEINKLNEAKTINIDDIVLAISDKLNPDKYEKWFLQLLASLTLRDGTKGKIQHIIEYNKHWINRNLQMIEERFK